MQVAFRLSYFQEKHYKIWSIFQWAAVTKKSDYLSPSFPLPSLKKGSSAEFQQNESSPQSLEE